MKIILLLSIIYCLLKIEKSWCESAGAFFCVWYFLSTCLVMRDKMIIIFVIYYYCLSMRIWLVVGYFAIINIITFVLRGVDKSRAVKEKWRIAEKKLLLYSALWGFVWAYLGMELFRHKRIKGKFMWKWLGIVLGRLVLGLMVWGILSKLNYTELL